MSNQSVKILFGTESGNAERVAIIAYKLAESLGFDSELIDMADFSVEQLHEWQNMLMVISTNGEGEMPFNAEACWEEAQARELNLENLNYAVLSLGDTAYDYFCKAGIDWDEYLEKSKARKIIDRDDLDVDFYQPSLDWLLNAFVHMSGQSSEKVIDVLDAVLNDASGSCEIPKGEQYDQNNPWQAEVIDNRNLSKIGSSKNVRHLSLKLENSNINYKPGDCIEILPVNDMGLIQQLMQYMNWDEQASVPYEGKKRPLKQVLFEHFELRQPSLKLLKFLCTNGPSAGMRNKIEVASKEEIEELLYGHDVLSLVQNYGKGLIEKTDFSSKLKKIFGKPQYFNRYDPIAFLKYLKPLQARAYSIASSQKVYNGEVHLTIADVEYEKDGREHRGGCTSYIAKLAVGQKLACWLLPNRYFALPENKSTDIIMVGPGTGIAPFVAFLQERKYQQADGRSWLFFGDRQEQYDFLYQQELQAFEHDGTLTNFDTAFSRDQAEKVYVQDKIAASGEELFSWLEAGAHLYLCGDAKHMAVDVEEAFINLIQDCSARSPEEAKDYLLAMQKEKRFLKDVY